MKTVSSNELSYLDTAVTRYINVTDGIDLDLLLLGVDVKINVRSKKTILDQQIKTSIFFSPTSHDLQDLLIFEAVVAITNGSTSCYPVEGT